MQMDESRDFFLSTEEEFIPSHFLPQNQDLGALVSSRFFLAYVFLIRLFPLRFAGHKTVDAIFGMERKYPLQFA